MAFTCEYAGAVAAAAVLLLALQLEGIRGRSGHSEVALVSFRGLEKREAEAE